MQEICFLSDRILGLFMSLQTIDLIIAGVLIFGFIWGFNKGFLYMFFSLLGIITGIFAGIKIPPILFSIFKFTPQVWHLVTGFILLFLICYSLSMRVSNFLLDILEEIDIEWLDSLLGGIIGIIQFFLLLGLIFSILKETNLITFLKAEKPSFLLTHLLKFFNLLIKFFFRS